MGEIDWAGWERLLRTRGVVIDRPKGSAHPRFLDWVYPVDYGYLPGTTGGDGDEVDVFAGHAETGLVGVLATHDAGKGDDEIKLLWNLTEADIAAVTAFLCRDAMAATLIRRPAAAGHPATGAPPDPDAPRPRPLHAIEPRRPRATKR